MVCSFSRGQGLLHKKSRHSGARPKAAGPEPIFQRPVFMGSGLAAEPVLGPRGARTRGRRPGMTVSDPAFRCGRFAPIFALIATAIAWPEPLMTNLAVTNDLFFDRTG